MVANDGCFGLCGHPSYPSAAAGSRPFQLIHDMSEQEESLETEDWQKKQEMDALLCQAMDSLSLEERQKQKEILHGIDNSDVEDAALVDRAMEDLDVQLGTIKHNSMYEVAERINADYVSARSFRVMFLRANDHDPKASAEQMLRFFDLKYQLFGIEKLVEDITLADLNADDIARLKTGRVQLAGRDKSGRLVMTHFAGTVDSVESWMRVLFFVRMRALQVEDTQLRGVVAIWCALGDYKSTTNGKGYFEIFKAGKAIPLKRAAVHCCTDEMRQFVLSNVMVKLMKSNTMARLRVHYGSPMECQYQLSTFGIQSFQT